MADEDLESPKTKRSNMEVPRTSKDELKSRINDPNVSIIDVRRRKEKEKIKNATPEDPEKVESWMAKYLRNKTLILYCS
jgi:rhodanese-related sulfurtransferase